MCKICGETKHEAKECWMRHVTLNNKEWTESNLGSPLQIDLSKSNPRSFLNLINSNSFLISLIDMLYP